MNNLYFGCAIIITYLVSSTAHAAPAIPEVQVTGTRIHMSDVVKNAPADIADTDLGAAPAAGGSRIFERGDLTAALGEHKLDVQVPAVVRVVRKMHKLDVSEIEKETRDAIAQTKLPRGASLVHVRPAHAMDVPEGWRTVKIEIPRPPHRAGAFPTTAMLSFEADGDTLAKIQVPIDLMLSQEAATPEMSHGSPVQLVIRRGLVEIATEATASGDGDAGDVIPVTIKASNRVLRARVMDATHALALEGQ